MPNSSLREPAPARKRGDVFNPSRIVCGFYPPDIVARQRDLSDGPKRLYERLVRWAGQNSSCWYSYERMAAELGKCMRQVKSDMAALERYGLIQHHRRGKRLANLYTFLWHPIFESANAQPNSPHAPAMTRDVQPGARYAVGEEVQVPASEVQPSARYEVQPGAHEFHPGNFGERSTSSSAKQQRKAPKEAEPEDDDCLSEKPTEKIVRRNLTEFVAAFKIATPAGRMPSTEMAEELDRIGATKAEFIEFLKGYVERWTETPATWRHMLVSFQRWAVDPRTQEAIRRRLAWQEAERRQRQAEAERQRVTTDVRYRDALALSGKMPVPRALEARLERTGETISPMKAAEQVDRRPCSICRDSGLFGNAIDRNLRFCECTAGEEFQSRQGPSWPSEEVARIHADTKSLLAAACYDQQMPFLGDALADANVTDDGHTLRIVPTAWHIRIGTISEVELQRALTRVGWRRTLQISA